MQLSDARRSILSTSAGEVMEALSLVTTEARRRLNDAVAVDPTNVLVAPPGSMSGGTSRAAASIRTSVATNRDNLLRLMREPFIAKVAVTDGDGAKVVLYVARGGVSALPLDGIRLVSYGSRLGRLAELPPGMECTLLGPMSKSEQATVSERVKLAPVLNEGVWDAKDTLFEWEDWKVVLASLAQLLERDSASTDGETTPQDVIGSLLQQHLESQLLRDSLRRRHIESISLRDQPILDVQQGNVFRLPLARKVWLVGPPGTGKTTTLIRRLSHKRTRETLSEEETDLLELHGLGESFFDPSGWAMFAPTELLKLYLHAAFNREGVAAPPANLKTWAKHRVHLGRNVLGILRSAERRGLQLDADAPVLARRDSSMGVELFERFSTHYATYLADRLEDSLDVIRKAGPAELWDRVSRLLPPDVLQAQFPEKMSRILDRREELAPDLKKLDEQVDSQIRSTVNSLLKRNQDFISELEVALASWQDDAADDGSDDDEDDADTGADARTGTQPTAGAAAMSLMLAVRAQARAVAKGRRASGRAGRILDLLGDRAPGREVLAPTGELLVLRQALRALLDGPRKFVMSAPRVYARFRREHSSDVALYGADADGYIKAGKISGPELDALILLMLRHARLLAQPRGIRTRLAPPGSGDDWMEAIQAEYICQVLVDEATDFSATQLGCMMELAHPALRSWFACGDFMQRITSEGVTTGTEIQWLSTLDGEPVNEESLSTGYRQSETLRRLVEAFSSSVNSNAVAIRPPETEHPDAVPPLVREHAVGADLAEWLAERIVEVEARLGVLPSIAIFVDGDERIDPLVSELRPLLDEHNIAVVGCKEGRVVGEEQEVRVFDVRYIKGLEFEAVFFVGVDRLADSLGALFAQLFLVGASRAATYLAITADASLPDLISPVRDQFSEGTWQ